MDSSIQDRYLRNPPSVRLGALAANLARMESFGDRVEHGDAVKGLILESEYFIEWAAKDVNFDILVELVELQRQLARWGYRWGEIWGNPAKREGMRAEAARWSFRILEHSGLLVEGGSETVAGRPCTRSPMDERNDR